MAIIMWIGWPGTGKTQGMCDYVNANSHQQTFFVTDRAAEWGSLAEDGSANPRWRGKAPAIVDVPFDFASADPADLYAWVEERRAEGIGVYLFRYPWDGWQVAQAAKDIGDTTYVDDEIDTFATKGKWESNPLRDIVHRGRHLVNCMGEVCTAHILGAARRPQSIHPDLTAIADQAFIYKVAGKLTLDRLRQDAWIDDDEWQHIRTLPNLHFKHWPSGQYQVITDAFGKSFAKKGKPPT